MGSIAESSGRGVSARLLVAVLVACGALALLAGSAQAATLFERVGAFAEVQPDFATVHHYQRVAVEHSTDRVFKTDVVGDRVVVYAPNGPGADELTGFGAGELVDPYGIAIDQSSGDVYVSDAGNNRVVRYLSDGQPTPAYTRDLGYAGPAQGAAAGEVGDFRAPIAIDQASGKLLVADPGSDLVKRYTAAGAYDGFSFDGSGSSGVFTGLQDLAIDSTGDVIVIDSDGGDPADGAITRIERFDSGGAWEATIGPVDYAAAVAVRPATDEVVVSGTQNAADLFVAPTLQVFDSLGRRETPVDGSATRSTISGIAVDDGPSGQMFVATDTSRGPVYSAMAGLASVQVYDVYVPSPPSVEPPLASALEILQRGATLSAEINPNSVETSYHFEYGTSDSYGNQTPPASAGDGTDPVAVYEQLSGLQAGTTYHFRIVADNGIGGPVEGSDQTFTTQPPLPPVVEPPAASASDVRPSSATLNASIDPEFSETTYYFEYGTTDGYGSQTDPALTWAVGDPVPVSQTLSGLEPDTTYHFRIVADNGVGGPVMGSDRTFTTPPLLPPVVEPPAAFVTGVGMNGATLKATVDPQSTATSWWFEYGPTDSYGSETFPFLAGSGTDPVPVSSQLSGLEPNTTYHFRIVADNGVGGPVVGADRTFVTDALPPLAVAVPTTEIAATSATLNGTVDTQGAAGSYSFRVEQIDGPYKHQTPTSEVSGGDDPVAVSAKVTGLPPNAKFIAWLSTATNGGAADGSRLRFSTPPLAADPQPPIAGDDNAYGCTAPRLVRPDRPVRPGAPIVLTGSDLGIDGAVTIAGRPAEVRDYRPSSVSIVVPDRVRGAVPVVVDCGRATAATTISIAPTNRFSLTIRSAGPAAARVVAKVPGRGRVTVRGGAIRAAAKQTGRPGKVRLWIELTRSGRRALARSRDGQIRRTVTVSYRPTGGIPRTVTRAVTFERTSR